jgi:hypothetical protein
VLVEQGSGVWVGLPSIHKKCADILSSANITIKFISRSNKTELQIAEFVKNHCQSQHVCKMMDNFKIPHHLAQANPQYAGIEFTAMVYQLMGTDLRRLSTAGEHLEGPNVPLTSKRRKKSIRDIIFGVAGLHRVGIVHGGKGLSLNSDYG